MKNKSDYTEILVVLGSPNSPSGELSDISKSRLDYCWKLYKNTQVILLTGGWGPHFNKSDKPHAYYGKEYLIEKGLSETAFLEFALSQNTVDDAVKIKSIISNFNAVKLTIITSNYHLDRVKLVFNEILSEYKMSFMGAKSNLTKEKLIKLKAHENRAIELIKKNGLYY
jgi:uncharacterized SAM-binding protein YcdF (DUF218 family)